MQTQATVREQLRPRMADACHQLARGIEVVVTHIELGVLRNGGDEMAADDGAAVVISPHEVAFLKVTERRAFVRVAGLRCLYGPENTAVIVDLLHSGRRLQRRGRSFWSG